MQLSNLTWLEPQNYTALSGLPMDTTIVYSFQGDWYFLTLMIMQTLLLMYIAFRVRNRRI